MSIPPINAQGEFSYVFVDNLPQNILTRTVQFSVATESDVMEWVLDTPGAVFAYIPDETTRNFAHAAVQREDGTRIVVVADLREQG